MEKERSEYVWYALIREFSQRYQNRTFRHSVHFVLFLMSMSFFFLFKKALFFLVFFLALNMITGIVIRGFLRKILFGVETIIFSTVLMGVAFGPHTGLITGIASAGVMLFFQRINLLHVAIFIPLYAGVGYLAGYLRDVNVTLLGITLSLLYCAASCFFIWCIGGKVWKCGWFTVTNLASNGFLFFTFAPLLLRIMT